MPGVGGKGEVGVRVRAGLGGQGEGVGEAVDGADVVRWAVEEEPDLVLLDVMMPRVDGWEALALLKEDHRTEHIPVIMVTARKSMEDMEYAEELGASDYVAKPWSPGELETRVNWALRKRAVPEYGDDFGLPTGFFECGCPMFKDDSEDDHLAPDDCVGNQSVAQLASLA